MPCGKLYTNDPKMNYDIIDKPYELKQFSTDNYVSVVSGPIIDYQLTQDKLPEINLDQLAILEKQDLENIENNNNKEFEKSKKHIDEIMKNVKSVEEINESVNNFEKQMNDKKKSLSFLKVENEQQGAEWYKANFPKLPDGFAEIMGRWNWGDLQDMTKKTSKNDRKKILKGNEKVKEKYQFKKTPGNYVITFD